MQGKEKEKENKRTFLSGLDTAERQRLQKYKKNGKQNRDSKWLVFNRPSLAGFEVTGDTALETFGAILTPQ